MSVGIPLAAVPNWPAAGRGATGWLWIRAVDPSRQAGPRRGGACREHRLTYQIYYELRCTESPLHGRRTRRHGHSDIARAAIGCTIRSAAGPYPVRISRASAVFRRGRGGPPNVVGWRLGRSSEAGLAAPLRPEIARARPKQAIR